MDASNKQEHHTMKSLKKYRGMIGGAAAAGLLAAAIAGPSVAQASTPAPCNWYPSQNRIRCDNGAVMTNYSEASRAATADAHYAGGIVYFVVCRTGSQCTWDRVR
jgi:hypothetical protein